MKKKTSKNIITRIQLIKEYIFFSSSKYDLFAEVIILSKLCLWENFSAKLENISII